MKRWGLQRRWGTQTCARGTPLPVRQEERCSVSAHSQLSVESVSWHNIDTGVLVQIALGTVTGSLFFNILLAFL
jgi:hypothetical protein